MSWEYGSTRVARNVAANAVKPALAAEVLISGDRGHSWGKLDRHFLYEDRTNPVRFLGNWNKVTGVQFSAFSAMESDVLGDSATLRFKGGGVGLVAPGSPDQGIAEVYVDGRLVTTVDQFSEAPADEPTLHHITGLAPGIHTITVKVSGEKNDRATGTRIVPSGRRRGKSIR